ncbi:endosome-associated-trafficking regulator 1 isoform 3, partial [Daubentonia madagascariensis]
MSGYPRRPGATPLSRARSLVIPDDDKLEDHEEANPFSFKEFLKTKNLGLSKEDTTNRIYSQLKDENSKLRRKLNEVQSFSETQTEMVRTLERKLEAKMIKEESDFRDLESVVQQVEQNLELMTKRAVKAENHVMKLKQEINLLQAQVSNFKRENEALRSGQGASLTVVKQNTDVALQNLRVVMNSAQASI